MLLKAIDHIFCRFVAVINHKNYNFREEKKKLFILKKALIKESVYCFYYDYNQGCDWLIWTTTLNMIGWFKLQKQLGKWISGK